MPIKKVIFNPGVNRENTRYATEGGWYECDKVRFRQGNPEKVGGWERISSNTFYGVCRSLWNWVTLSGQDLMGVGTHLKFYIERGGVYYDVTPLRATTAAGDVTFSASNGDATITVTDTAHGASVNDYVTFSGASSLGGNITADVLNQEYQISRVVGANSYEIEAKDTAGATVTANASDTGNGGAAVVGAYQIHVGADIATPISGWGGGSWGSGPWGSGGSTTTAIRLWSQNNFGEDLVFSHRDGAIYYWDATSGTSTRGVLLSSLTGASDVPTVSNLTLVSDINRFVFSFGCNDYDSATLDPMLIRWSDQENAANWTPDAANQAGSLRVSHGTEIVTAIQARQEVLVFTDSSVYSLQYLGAPEVWGAQLLGDAVSIASPMAVAYVSNIAFWMGRDKFYVYDGTVSALPCDLRRYVFSDFNREQYAQVHAGVNNAFHEVWWFYCSSESTEIDKYVVYNYKDRIWYYGTLGRTAWIDSGLRRYSVAATYTNNLVYHEVGTDDKETGTPAAINAYLVSSQFDLDDGHHFTFINAVLPDVNFEGSDVASPSIAMTFYPLTSSGSGYLNPESVGGEYSGDVIRGATSPVEAYTERLDLRLRGRQMAMRVESVDLGVAWQLGSVRMDMRPDGRR